MKVHLRLFTSAHLGEKPHPRTWRNLSKRRKYIELFSKKKYFVDPAVHDPPLVVDQEGAVGDLLPETWIWWKVLLRVPASGNVTGNCLWGGKMVAAFQEREIFGKSCDQKYDIPHARSRIYVCWAWGCQVVFSFSHHLLYLVGLLKCWKGGVFEELLMSNL